MISILQGFAFLFMSVFFVFTMKANRRLHRHIAMTYDELKNLSEKALSIKAIRNPEEFDLNYPEGTLWTNTNSLELFILERIEAKWKAVGKAEPTIQTIVKGG